ncbi:MAG: YdcF family protein [Prevotellaceae bacterium]|jgi:SanA protein|nr:YdcF family protein [Prevotellaceae bacterium]
MKLQNIFKRNLCRKTIIIPLIIIALLSAFAIIFADKKIKNKSKNFLFSDITKISENRVGLLLGTSKFLSNGHENLYYKYRIEAAIALYKAQKIKYIVVSGDNSRKTYDEPSQMKTDLIAGGVPETAIFLDYAGFRTLDSVIRMKEIFGQNSFVIISQKFHNERAVFLARHNNLNAVGFNAKDVDKYFGFKTNVREKFARVKVFIDFLTHKQPKFLGEKIEIE